VSTVSTGKIDDIDLSLIEAARRGEKSAWDAFVGRHDRWVRAVVSSTLGRPSQVEDVRQLVWTRVWQQIGTLADSLRWRAWLYRLARNAAIDQGKAATRRRRAFPEMADGFEAPSYEPTPAEEAIDAERHQRVMSAIQGLPAIYREPFILRHLEDWNYARIAETLDLPVDTVETRLVRARRLLREALRGIRAQED
jgi:RNA polymerase sigma-70 factor (ECF subfamily)